jgi:hypothetical protein
MLPHESISFSSTARLGVCLAPWARGARAVADAPPGMEEDMSHINRSMKSWIVSCGVALASAAALAQTLGAPEHFTAAAIDMNRGAAGPIEVQVDRWSTDAQRDRLVKALLTKGADKLLDTLQDMPVMGHFNAPGRLGIDIRFARHYPGEDGGERVVIATDRRIGFLEARNQPRSIDYPFTVIELALNRDGEGEGRMSLATKVIYDRKKNMITLENFQLQPVLLTQVRRNAESN